MRDKCCALERSHVLHYPALGFSSDILHSKVCAQGNFLMHAVRVAQQCAGRGLLNLILVSSDNAFMICMVGPHLPSHFTALQYSCALYTCGL